jgi:hypothetical protein
MSAPYVASLTIIKIVGFTKDWALLKIGTSVIPLEGSRSGREREPPQLTANTKQQTADSRQQTADSRQLIL